MKDSNRKVILIGGAPTTGKSTVASLLAKKLGLPWISYDQVREIMQITTNRKDYPKLFTPEGYGAEKFLTEFSAEQIVQMEREQGEAVWPAIKKLVDDDYHWKDGVIIEGVGILPSLIFRDFGDDKNIKPIFLIDENPSKIREVVFTRGLWADAHTYSDDVKEKEVEWALLFSQKLKAEAEKYNFPVISVQRNDYDLEAILKIV
jgi:2-phosphoglycerate kinase